jgi:hypothetical protein
MRLEKGGPKYRLGTCFRADDVVSEPELDAILSILIMPHILAPGFILNS